MSAERWVPIFGGRYEVSELGNVRSWTEAGPGDYRRAFPRDLTRLGVQRDVIALTPAHGEPQQRFRIAELVTEAFAPERLRMIDTVATCVHGWIPLTPLFEKRCIGCDSLRSPLDFARSRRQRDGLAQICLDCSGRRTAAWLARPGNRERRQQYENERNRRPEVRKRLAANHARQATLQRRHKLKVKYGLTLEAVDEMLARQGKACAACRTPFDSTGPVVDHDHQTGRVRGLLCRNCNLALGHAADSPERLRALLNYVEAPCAWP